jgi:hypothetical protein
VKTTPKQMTHNIDALNRSRRTRLESSARIASGENYFFNKYQIVRLARDILISPPYPVLCPVKSMGYE